MNKISLNIIAKVFLILWGIIWLDLILKDFKYNSFHYFVLLSRGSEGKRSYVYGDCFYELLVLAQKSMPRTSTYNIYGIPKGSIQDRRAIFFLYPCIQKEDPDFIIVYNMPGRIEPGYQLYKALDNSRFILKK